ncbi:MAG: PEP-CTERM sorting domain-containing protein [Pirellulales bacterium]
MSTFHCFRTVLSAFLTALTLAGSAQAMLTIAPTFNKVAGSGPSDTSLGLLSHTPLQKPGDHFAYVAGDPRDPVLDVVNFYNDTTYDITGFYLQIIGTGTNTQDPSTIVVDPNVEAKFGDVPGHPIASDIFSQYEISADGKTIHFFGGVIPPGGRFTDLHYADSTLVPELKAFDYAAIDSWFVPEPSSSLLGMIGLTSLLSFRRRRSV